MCSLCGTLGSAAHWSEGGGDRTQVGARREVLRERIRKGLQLFSSEVMPNIAHL